MEDDSLRKKLEFKIYCSKHPDNELLFSTESKFGASSAYTINGKIFIHPCSVCRSEKERLENAARVLVSAANSK